MTKVLIIGAGAIGAFYGALLAKVGVDVAVVCRSNYHRVKERGFTIQSEIFGQWHFMPSQVVSTVEDYHDCADYVLLCCKVLPDIDRVKLIKPAIHENTAIVFIQNGVEIEQELIEAFPQQPVISGLAFICVNQTAPSHIHHLAYGRLVLGDLPYGISPHTKQLSDYFSLSGIECSASADIVTERWKKCIWNAPFNPLSVLSGGLTTADILQSQEPFVRLIMQDVVNIANALGHPVSASLIDANMTNTHAMPPYKTSMLLDFENHRPMEIEAILGNARRAAQRVNISVPYLDALYALLQLRSLS
ncbi:MAG: 2-dehydropantoate 2-reductase [Methylococcaceae bacterium]|jgi:2-dehydropantoate 2-reductase